MKRHSAAETPARPLQEAGEADQQRAAHHLAARSGGPWPAPRSRMLRWNARCSAGLDRRAGEVAEAGVDAVRGRAGRRGARACAPRCGVDRVEQRRRDRDRLVLDHDAPVAGGVELVRPLEEDHR